MILIHHYYVTVHGDSPRAPQRSVGWSTKRHPKRSWLLSHRKGVGKIFKSLESETVQSLGSLKLQFSVSVILLYASQVLFDVTISGLFQPKMKISGKAFWMEIGPVVISSSLKSLRGVGEWRVVMQTIQRVSPAYCRKWQSAMFFSFCSLANYGIEGLFVCFVTTRQNESKRCLPYWERKFHLTKRLGLYLYFTHFDFEEDLKF